MKKSPFIVTAVFCFLLIVLGIALSFAGVIAWTTFFFVAIITPMVLAGFLEISDNL